MQAPETTAEDRSIPWLKQLPFLAVHVAAVVGVVVVGWS